MSARPLFHRALSPLFFALVPRTRSYMRAPGARALKRWWYRCFADPYTNFVDTPVRVVASFGGVFEGRLSGVVQRSLFHFGLFEPNLTALIVGRLRPGDTFIDVGANVGYFTLLASKLVGPEGQVVSIEASPTTYAALRKNIEANDATNVRTVNVAAFDCEASVPIYYLPEEEFTSGASLFRAIGPKEAIVSAKPLAIILSANELLNARLIKIDVEGAEERVVAGLLQAERHLRPDVEIVVEVLPELFDAVRTRFAEHGFGASILDNPLDPLADANACARPRPIPPGVRPAEVAMSHGVIYLLFSRGPALR
ncbi:MAG: FkbM family methyltransferase [Candidatus Baltobacteraceae bacterium]